VIDEDDIDVHGLDQRLDFFDFPGADEGGLIEGRAGLEDRVENFSAGAVGKSAELGQRLLGLRRAGFAPPADDLDTDEDGAFARRPRSAWGTRLRVQPSAPSAGAGFGARPGAPAG